MRVFDAIIIGGGLAGASTALHLSKKGYSVLILEKTKEKLLIPCAGGMASSMKKLLPINFESTIETEVKNVHFTWQSKDSVIAELSGESPFLIINREGLDNLLIKKATQFGAEIIQPINILGLIKHDENWTINCNNNKNFRGKFLVVADGSSSKWSIFLNLGPRKPKYAQTIALRLSGLGNLTKNSVRFDFGSVKYGFAWAFPMKEYVNIGLGTFIGNYKINNKELNNKIIEDFGFERINFEPLHKKLRIWNGFYKLHTERALAVGDAASLCDPFLAEGIRPSLISSYYAAKCIDDCLSQGNLDLNEYSEIIKREWSQSMVWGKRIAEVFYRFPQTGYRLGVKRKTAPKRIAQILSGEMSYEDIARRVIKRLLLRKT